MSVPTSNESWLIDAGDVVIQKQALSGDASLSALERLIYCVWVADYGMRNAGDLEAAHDYRTRTGACFSTRCGR